MSYTIEKLTSSSEKEDGSWSGGFDFKITTHELSPTPLSGVEILAHRPSRTSSRHEKLLRRLRGFLVEIRGETSLVAFIEAGNTFTYSLPTSRLQSADIRVENQPFEMDEVEITSEDSETIFGTKFRPLVPSRDAKLETLEFPAGYREERDEVLKYFKNASV